MRLGSLPFPGPFTLYAVADAKDLGVHSYEGPLEVHDGHLETGRGILYTCRAGFLDLSHLRESIDIAKYAHDRILERLGGGPRRPPTGSFSLRWSDATYEITVSPPEWWESLGDSQRVALSEEAAIRQAQRFVVIVGSWHELGTWYGQQTIPLISEKKSAFTWDDTTSHVVAAIVAGRALRIRDRSWNIAVTEELERELADLGVVDPECEAAAVRQVRGLWWKDDAAVRRDLDTGLDGGFKTPWLAPGLDCCAGAEPALLPLLDLSDVLGYDMRSCFGLRIRPQHWLLCQAMGSHSYPEAITSEAELLTAIENVRTAIKAEYGANADRP